MNVSTFSYTLTRTSLERLNKSCLYALEQIHKHPYFESLQRQGVSKIYLFGIAFGNKRVRIQTEVVEKDESGKNPILS